MTTFPDIFRNMHFLNETTYRLPELTIQSLKGAHKVLAKSLKTVFDEVHFIVNLLYQNLINKYEDDLEHYLGYYILDDL